MIAGQLLPPILSRALTRHRRNRFTGDYENWDAALADASGYDHPDILARARDAARAVVCGDAAYERDTVTFRHREVNWPVVAGLYRAAVHTGGPLRVMDIGGAFGSTYQQCRAALDAVTDLRWFVVEQPRFAEAGVKEFQTEQLRFYASVEACTDAHSVDVALLASVLPYLTSPHALLDRLYRLEIAHVIIDRTPFLVSPRPDRLTVQHVPAAIYQASYPAWFFSMGTFRKFMASRYREVHSFLCPDRANIPCVYKGFFLDRI